MNQPISYPQFVADVHRSLNVEEVAAVAANDGRQLLGCDRLSVAVTRGKKTTIAAVSGQETINSRANIVRLLRELATAVVHYGQPVVFGMREQELPAYLEEPLANYVREAGVRVVYAYPLFRPDSLVHSGDDEPHSRANTSRNPAVGCLIADHISVDGLAGHNADRYFDLANQIATALANAVAHQRVPLMPMWQWMGRNLEWFRGRRLALSLAALLALAACIAALVVVPWEYRVVAEGKLMPVEQSAVFAPWNGVVENVHVESGARVHDGQSLLTLRNDELTEQLLAKKNEVAEKRNTLRAVLARIDDALDEGDRQLVTQLQGEAETTRLEIQGATQQLEVLEKRETELTVTAPRTGIVTTFQLKQLLHDRPVNRGELLMEVMESEGDWRLELLVDERRVGHLLEAMARDNENRLPVEFVLGTVTETTYSAIISDVASRTQKSDEQGQGLVMLAEIDHEKVPHRRIGAEVHARIACGKKSLGYVLFGDVIDFLRERLWL